MTAARKLGFFEKPVYELFMHDGPSNEVITYKQFIEQNTAKDNRQRDHGSSDEELKTEEDNKSYDDDDNELADEVA